jgi:hypothetical protein
VILSDWVAFCCTSSERSFSEAFAEAARAAKPERVRVIALKILSGVPVAAQKARRNSHGEAVFRAASSWIEKKILLSVRGTRKGAFLASSWGWGAGAGLATACAYELPDLWAGWLAGWAGADWVVVLARGLRGAGSEERP